MPLSGIDQVRMLIGDMDKLAYRELVTENADGTSTTYKANMFPIRTGSIILHISGIRVLSATANYPIGLIDLSGSTLSGGGTATANAQIQATYQYNALSNDEIQFAIDVASGDGQLLAGSYAARALAGNFARFFAYKQGDKLVDKRQVSRDLLALAESLEKAHDNAILKGGTTLTVATFDDSGTFYENYDSAIATQLTGTT